MFLYPSSIAAYGLPDIETRMRAKRVREDEWNTPTTMYGCNKLYCEPLGRYYACHYKQLSAEATARRDWGFAPRYDFTRAFDEYLIPTIRERYRT